MNATETFTRNELYDLVWSTPLTTIAKKYNLTDNGLRKLCDRMNIPLPNAGHWMKLQFGKSVQIVPLSEKFEGEATATLALRSDNGNSNSTEADPILQEIRNDTRLSLTVPEQLKYPDPLIVAAKELLTSKENHTHYRYERMVGCSRNELDIRVTPKNVIRALCFMDTLIKAIRNRGGDIILNGDFTYARVKGQKFRIALREKTKRIDKSDKNWPTHEPLNILYFKYDGYTSREWKDGKHPLEYYVPHILARLEKVSDELTFEQQKHRHHMESLRNKEQLVKDAIALKEKELENFKKLLHQAERWEKTKILRHYIDEVECKGIASFNSLDQQQSWIVWARKKANWYDPFIEAEDEMLDGIDRNTLTSLGK